MNMFNFTLNLTVYVASDSLIYRLIEIKCIKHDRGISRRSFGSMCCTDELADRSPKG